MVQENPFGGKTSPTEPGAEDMARSALPNLSDAKLEERIQGLESFRKTLKVGEEGGAEVDGRQETIDLASLLAEKERREGLK